MEDSTPGPASPPPQSYPTRQCRLCYEEVVPTVTVSHLSLPAAFQRIDIAYVSEDCGRLIKPCHCKGHRRYIHEECLRQLRRKSTRQDGYLRCDICQFQYNTKRLLLHDLLRSRIVRMALTVVVILVLIFILGFVADPIINLYVDPLETMATRKYWEPVTVNEVGMTVSWAQHFMKGFASIGVVGFLKALLLSNPWQFWNLRNTGLMGGRANTSATGRDRAVSISWIALVIGVGSAVYFFYKQVQKSTDKFLSGVAHAVLEVPLEGDDDDLKAFAQAVEKDSLKAAANPDEADAFGRAAANSATSREIGDSKDIEDGKNTVDKTKPLDIRSVFDEDTKMAGSYVIIDREGLEPRAEDTAFQSSHIPVPELSSLSRRLGKPATCNLESDSVGALYGTTVDDARTAGWSFSSLEDSSNTKSS